MATSKRIFVGFSVEDRWARDLLRGQARLSGSPIAYTDYSVKKPWDATWKTECRKRIRGCDGFIGLLSRNIRGADGARSEIKCAVGGGVPALGVHINRDDDYTPPEMAGKRVIRWSWHGIGNWIARL